MIKLFNSTDTLLDNKADVSDIKEDEYVCIHMK